MRHGFVRLLRVSLRDFIVYLFLTAGALGLNANGARAADITLHELDGLTIIAFWGGVEPGDETRFDQLATLALQRGLPTVVELSSPGGDVITGAEVGLTVHRAGFATLVGDDQFCTSMCGMIWLAGRDRFASPLSAVGFHQAYRTRDGENDSSPEGNAILGHYVGELRLPRSVIHMVTKRGPDSMEWMSFSIADEIGLSVEMLEPKLDWHPNDLMPYAMGRDGRPRPASKVCSSGEVVPIDVDCEPTGSIPDRGRDAEPDASVPSQPLPPSGYCPECLAAADPEIVPNFDNVVRAITNVRAQIASEDAASLLDSSRQCWGFFESNRTARVLQYCYVVDLIGASTVGGTHFALPTVERRLNEAAARVVDPQFLRPDHVRAWWDEVNSIYLARR